MTLEEKNAGWRRIEKPREIDLGEYKVIKGPEDWRKGVEKAVETILDRIEASHQVEERAREIMGNVISNQAEFSGKNRICIASGIVYFALKGEVDMKKLTKAGSISTTSIRNMVDRMNEVDLN